MKKVLKYGAFTFGFLMFITIASLIILELTGVLPDLPEDELETQPVEKVQETKKAEAPEPQQVEAKQHPPPKPKRIDWNKTPSEQGLKVGDWIIAQGESEGYVGATAVRKRNRNYELSDYFSLSDLLTGTGNYFLKTIRGGTKLQVWELEKSKGINLFRLVSPNRYPLTSKLKIGAVDIFGDIPTSSNSHAIREYNQLMLHDQNNITELAVSGKITKISEPETVEGIDLQYININYLEGSTIRLTATVDEISQAMRQAISKATAIKGEFIQLSKQFLFDGSHLTTVEFVKKNMHNPKSFKHVSTTFQTNKEEGYRIIEMKYRGTNAYNAIVTNMISVKADLKGNLLEVLKPE